MLRKQFASSLQIRVPRTHGSTVASEYDRTSTATSPQNTGTDTNGQKGYDRLSFVRVAVGFGVGLIFGATLKTYYDEKTSRNEKSSVFPTVCAANPLSYTQPDNTQNDAKPVSRRMVYNFVADAVEKASDKVVFIDIKDNRR